MSNEHNTTQQNKSQEFGRGFRYGFSELPIITEPPEDGNGDGGSQVVGNQLQPYISAMLGATGITEWQAGLCVLYALLTWLQDQLDYIPALVWTGPTGTGKSTGIEQLSHMVKEHKYIESRTSATLRDELGGLNTALIDEGDGLDEGLLRSRTERRQSQIKHKVRTPWGWEDRPTDVFGATVVARRKPIEAQDLRNRSIIVRTKDDGLEPDQRHYKITSIGDLEGVAKMIGQPTKEDAGRVADTWGSLLFLASSLGLQGWTQEAQDEIKRELKSFKSKHGYEPGMAVLAAIDNKTWDGVRGRVDGNIPLSTIVRFVQDECAVSLKPGQVEDLATELGFEVGNTHGNRTVKVDLALLDTLLRKIP